MKLIDVYPNEVAAQPALGNYQRMVSADMTEIGGMMCHYKILEKPGEGGMGVVYRAEDTNLRRQVAVKVLPDIFSGDPERLARFEREARLLASLSWRR